MQEVEIYERPKLGSSASIVMEASNSIATNTGPVVLTGLGKFTKRGSPEIEPSPILPIASPIVVSNRPNTVSGSRLPSSLAPYNTIENGLSRSSPYVTAALR